MDAKAALIILGTLMVHCSALPDKACSNSAAPAKGLGLMQFKKGAMMSTVHLGDPRCPCVGIDNITGSTTVVVHGSTRAQYPAETGSHCAAWDDGFDPVSCLEGEVPGRGHGWCVQPWCYVDPCNCDLDIKPKPASYLPDGSYQGKPLYFSYATCNGEDTWSAEQSLELKPPDKATMCESNVFASSDIGKSECKCIGINGEEGSTEFTVSGKSIAFRADAGTKCGAWDLQSNPECSGDAGKIPPWCAKKWCFVDPCSCSLAVSPKVSSYLPYARVGGKSVYFSYDTCGDEDVWTTKNYKHACVNQESQKACLNQSQCGWDSGKKKCLGKDLLAECHTAAAPKAAHGWHDWLDRKRAETTVERAAQHLADADSAMKAAKAVEKLARAEKHKSTVEAERARVVEQKSESQALKANATAIRDDEKVLALRKREKNVTAKAEAAKVTKDKMAAKVAEEETDVAKAVDRLKQLKAEERAAANKAEAAKSAENVLVAEVKKAAEDVEATKAAENLTAERAAITKITEFEWFSKLEKLKAAEKNAMHEAKEAHMAAEKAAGRAEMAKEGSREATAKAAEENRTLSKAAAEVHVRLQADRLANARFESLYGHHGHSECPCVGIDNLTGSTTVIVQGGTSVKYPADAGAHCAAWDNGREPVSCMEGEVPGSGRGWCAQPWCYVDPCNCNLELKPKATSYLPDGQYQGKPIYYSYATCGGKDTWSKEQTHEIKVADKAMCGEKDYDSWYGGKNDCKCIGINGEDGSTEFTVSGKSVAFPANAGTNCGSWDLESNPECSGNATEIPALCAKKWCFVDPCSCSLAVPPKTSSYLPYARVGGRSVYFSYDTCGDDDVWTAKNHKHACVNQKFEKACLKLAQCGWDADKSKCLGKDLLHQCKHPNPIVVTSTTTETPKVAHKGERNLAGQLIPASASVALAVLTFAVIHD